MRFVFFTAIRFYKVCISPLLPVACRFWPTCSEYAAEAVRLHGMRAGSLLAARRILRCHPFGGCGCDPVPSHTAKGTSA